MLPKDPFILLSYINTQLRDNYDSLDSLCSDKDEDMESIEKNLDAIGYHYDPATNSFK